MDAKEFLTQKGISLNSANAARLPHKEENIDFSIIELMEEYAKEKFQQEIKALRRWDVHSSGSEALAISADNGDWLDIEDVYRVAGIDPIEIDYPTDK
jgi:hypothetical protein